MDEPRIDQLLIESAKHLLDGKDPFHESFLVEHNVTLDEVLDMSDQIALCILVAAELRDEPAFGKVKVETWVRAATRASELTS